jgi:APA family basic amino acid/polyamine antiporter
MTDQTKDGETSGLKSTLSFPVILLITINSIMGTGIFFLPAVGAGKSGVMSIFAWIILSVISMYIAMCFGELASMFPKSGGIYEFCKQAYGCFVSFLIGWITLIVGNITIAMLVVGAVRYLNPGLPSYINIGISLIFILLFNFMAYKGLKTSAVMLVTFAIITLVSLFGLIIPGFFSFDPGNLTPLFTHSWPAVLLTIFFIAETFFGWETVTFLAEETKNPKKVIPKALIWGTAIISIICLLFILTALGTVHWSIFAESSAPLSLLANIHYGQFGVVFTILVYLSIIGSVAGWIVSAPRLILALAKDKLFIVQCAKIHPKNNTPYVAIILQTVLTSILVIIGAGSYDDLLHLLLPLVLVIYAFTLLTLPILRFKQKNTERPYKVIFGKVGPVIVALMMMGLLAYWVATDATAIRTVQLAFSFVLIGIPLYFLLQLYYDPSAQRFMSDKLAPLSLLTENWNIPRHIRKEVFVLLGDLKGKKVLEYGAGVGTLTLDLVEAVGPTGIVYATNHSKGEIKVLESRLKKNEIINVRAIHDEHHSSRVHPSVPKVDMFVSVGNLSYVQDVRKIVKAMSDRLPLGGKFCIIEYIDFYHLIPNTHWLNDYHEIYEIFKERGFLIRVVKKKGTLWNYLFIYGIKKNVSSHVYI